MDKIVALKKLEVEIRADISLPLQESNLVFGEGNPDCTVLFVGEAPGFHEDQQGRPFVGRAGKLLDELIMGISWKRADVYITNIVKRRPPENRDPLPAEIEAYKPYLARQIEIIAPKVIAPLGRFSMNYFLPFAKISNDHGKIFEIQHRRIYPLYHPAAALRATAVLNALREDFKHLPDVTAGKITPPKIEIPKLLNKKEPPQSTLF